jgi:hypothetical protein
MRSSRNVGANRVRVVGPPSRSTVIDAVLSKQRTVAINPVELEAKALRRWEAVEGRRRVLAAMTFPTLGSNTHLRVV